MASQGTPEYIAPEIVTGQGYDQRVDYWALGVTLYELFMGYTPFNEYRTQIGKLLESLASRKPIDLDPLVQACSDKDFVDLVSKLLVKDPSYRLGSSEGALDIMKHDFFKNVDFEELENRSHKLESGVLGE